MHLVCMSADYRPKHHIITCHRVPYDPPAPRPPYSRFVSYHSPTHRRPCLRNERLLQDMFQHEVSEYVIEVIYYIHFADKCISICFKTSYSIVAPGLNCGSQSTTSTISIHVTRSGCKHVCFQVQPALPNVVTHTGVYLTQPT